MNSKILLLKSKIIGLFTSSTNKQKCIQKGDKEVNKQQQHQYKKGRLRTKQSTTKFPIKKADKQLNRQQQH